MCVCDGIETCFRCLYTIKYTYNCIIISVLYNTRPGSAEAVERRSALARMAELFYVHLLCKTQMAELMDFYCFRADCVAPSLCANSTTISVHSSLHSRAKRAYLGNSNIVYNGRVDVFFFFSFFRGGRVARSRCANSTISSVHSSLHSRARRAWFCSTCYCTATETSLTILCRAPTPMCSFSRC